MPITACRPPIRPSPTPPAPTPPHHQLAHPVAHPDPGDPAMPITARRPEGWDAAMASARSASCSTRSSYHSPAHA
eukprot:28400-Chlamydomonas_euryale.AAC.1